MNNQEPKQQMLANLKPTDSVLIKPEHDYPVEAIVVSVDHEKQTIVGSVCLTKNPKYGLAEHVEFPFHDIDRINGRYVLSRLRHYGGWHPDVDLVVSVGEDQQVRELDQPQILWESLQHMARKANSERSRCIRAYAQVINNAVRELEIMGEYNCLNDLGINLLQASVKLPDHVRESLEGFEKNMLVYNKIQLRMARMSMDELKAILTPEAQADILKDLADDK